jgi:hypothetical protein
VEYVWFALAMVACLGLIFAIITNCQWAAGFFTLLLGVLCVLFGLMALLLFALASIGNDTCACFLPFISLACALSARMLSC